jgi:hypothetical protein
MSWRGRSTSIWCALCFHRQTDKLQEKQPGDEAILQLTAKIKVNWRGAVIGDLKSAFLAAFAVFGYRFAVHPRLNDMREQIQSWDRERVGRLVARRPAVGPGSHAHARGEAVC